MLVFSRKQKETIIIDGTILVTVLSIHGNQVKVGIEAPSEVPVHRQEVQQRIGRQGVATSVSERAKGERG